MLLDDDNWNNMYEEIEEEASQSIKLSIDSDIFQKTKVQNRCWEMLFLIPNVEKRLLFEQRFPPFL